MTSKVASRHWRPVTLALSMLAMHSAVAGDQVMMTLFAGGVDHSRITLTGDMKVEKSINALDLGFEIEVPNVLLYGKMPTDFAEDIPRLQLLIGAGQKDWKLATGFIAIQTGSPNPFVNGHGYFVTNQAETAELSNTSVPLYGRWHLLNEANYRLTVSGYRSLATKSSLRIPVKVLGLDAYIDTESVSSGVQWGGGMELLWRMRPSLGLKAEYWHAEAVIEGQRVPIKGDIFHAFSPVDLPQLKYKQNTIGVSLVWLVGK